MRLYGKINRKSLACVAAVLVLSLGALPAFASEAVIVPERDTQLVMGDLYALSLAMRLYREDTYITSLKETPPCPAPSQLARYFKTPLSAADCRTAAVGGAWWAGRRVPGLSRARKFLRENAPSLGLYDKESMSAWLGGEYVWVIAVSFDKTGGAPTHVAPGKDGQHLFFNSPGSEYYWWSDLLYTPEGYASALKKFGKPKTGPLSIPPVPVETPENFSASPISPPPDFSLGGDEEDPQTIKLGDVILNPVPRGPR